MRCGAFAAAGRESVTAGMGLGLFQMVGRLYPGRWGGRARRQGRGRQGHRVFHDAHRAAQRCCFRGPDTSDRGHCRRNTAATWSTLPCVRAIQLHWLTIEALPEIIERLDAAGLSPKGACGDVVRNVTGCPLAGLDADELMDASPFALAAAGDMNGNSELYNLPRKFKVSITGCSVWCSYPEINDIGLTPPCASNGNGREVGFSVRVGGGLSADPHLAVRLNAFVQQHQAVDSGAQDHRALSRSAGLRESRDRARMKHLFLREGWTAETFLAELNRRLGYQLDPAVEEDNS